MRYGMLEPPSEWGERGASVRPTQYQPWGRSGAGPQDSRQGRCFGFRESDAQGGKTHKCRQQLTGTYTTQVLVSVWLRCAVKVDGWDAGL